MKKVILKSILACLILANGSCANPDSAGSSDGSSTAPPPTVVPDPPVATAASPLQLQIQTIYDKTEEIVTHKFQETGTTTCEATDSNPVVTCTITVPEARLFFSKVRFNYSWRNDKCKLMFFHPYYYKASTSAAYSPVWVDSPIDCSKSPIPGDCFGGAAPQIVPGFPKTDSIIHPSDPTTTSPQSDHKDLASGWSLQRYYSNRTTVNDIAPSKKGSNQSFPAENETYLANTYVDYQFICRDDWYDDQTYKITVFIKDEDSAGPPPQDHFSTWKELP
jgi:hypothetical protein